MSKNKSFDAKAAIDRDVRAMFAEDPTPCEWFALCEHPATHARPGADGTPIPICDRCADRVGY